MLPAWVNNIAVHYVIPQPSVFPRIPSHSVHWTNAFDPVNGYPAPYYALAIGCGVVGGFFAIRKWIRSDARLEAGTCLPHEAFVDKIKAVAIAVIAVLCGLAAYDNGRSLERPQRYYFEAEIYPR